MLSSSFFCPSCSSSGPIGLPQRSPTRLVPWHSLSAVPVGLVLALSPHLPTSLPFTTTLFSTDVVQSSARPSSVDSREVQA